MTTPVTEARRAAIFAMAAKRAADPASRELAAAVPELLDALDRAHQGFLKAIGERDAALAERDAQRAEFVALAEVAANLELLVHAAQPGGAA